MSNNLYPVLSLDPTSKTIVLINFLDKYAESFLPIGCEESQSFFPEFNHKEDSRLNIYIDRDFGSAFLVELLGINTNIVEINSHNNFIFQEITLNFKQFTLTKYINKNILDIINPLKNFPYVFFG